MRALLGMLWHSQLCVSFRKQVAIQPLGLVLILFASLLLHHSDFTEKHNNLSFLTGMDLKHILMGCKLMDPLAAFFSAYSLTHVHSPSGHLRFFFFP